MFLLVPSFALTANCRTIHPFPPSPPSLLSQFFWPLSGPRMKSYSAEEEEENQQTKKSGRNSTPSPFFPPVIPARWLLRPKWPGGKSKSLAAINHPPDLDGPTAPPGYPSYCKSNSRFLAREWGCKTVEKRGALAFSSGSKATKTDGQTLFSSPQLEISHGAAAEWPPCTSFRKVEEEEERKTSQRKLFLEGYEHVPQERASKGISEKEEDSKLCIIPRRVINCE